MLAPKPQQKHPKARPTRLDYLIRKAAMEKTVLIVLEPRELRLSGKELTQAFLAISEDRQPSLKALKKLTLEDWETLALLLDDLVRELELATSEGAVH